MPELLRLLIAILVTYRLAGLVAIDDGPLSIFQRLRQVPIGELRKLVNCPYCVGVWAALGIAWWLFGDYAPEWRLAWALAIAGGQALLQELSDYWEVRR